MVAIMLLIMFANRLKVAYPILLVLGGLAISLIPNMPAITLNPDLVLIIFLPPLLYADGTYHFLTASSVCRCFFAITERDVEVAPHYL